MMYMVLRIVSGGSRSARVKSNLHAHHRGKTPSYPETVKTTPLLDQLAQTSLVYTHC
jgi:hypothetical protein